MSDPASSRLPARPSLEQLRKQAKELVQSCRAGDPAALERVRRHKPALTAPALADAQFALAREYGFESWPKLARHIEIRAAPHGLSPRPPFYRIDWSENRLEPQQPLTNREWDSIIDVMRDTGLTTLHANGLMTDAALERLSSLEQLTSLNLGGTRLVTDAGLAHLARMPQLVELDLSDHPGGTITDRGLEALRHLPALRRFAMCWSRGISDRGMANLAFCDRLESVDLLGSPTGDGAIDALRGKPRLRKLKTGRLVTDAGLSLLHELPAFKTWRGEAPRYDLMSFGDTDPNFLMLDGPFGNAALGRLAGLEGLFGIGFFWHVSRLTSDGLAALAGLPNLGALACEGKLCDDTAMGHIAALPRLRMLMAQGTVASDAGFAALSRSRSIEYIWGRECPNLGGRGFAALAELPALRGLAVSCRNVDDAALSALPSFPALTWLLPMDVPDDGFRHVGACVRLERLTCMYCRDTGDAATEHIAGLSRLTHYYAGQTRITDRSLEILSRMTSLEDIALSACAGITDAGLAHLAALPRLQKLSVDAAGAVTRAGVGIFPERVQVNFYA